jgi:hypothetical protein
VGAWVGLGEQLFSWVESCIVWYGFVCELRTDGRTDREIKRRLPLLPSFGGSSIIKEVDG